MSLHDAKRPQDVIALYRHQYDAGIADGSIIPFTYPLFSVGIGIVLLYLLTPPKSTLHSPVVAAGIIFVLIYWHAYLIINSRSFNPAPAFGIGILFSWGTLWSATLIIFNDAKREFKRLESKPYIEQQANLLQSHAAEPASPTTFEKGGLERAGPHEASKYAWQHYPLSPLLSRVDWVADLFTNFRGVGWTYRISGLPSLPAHIQASLPSPSPSKDPSSKEEPVTDHPVSRGGVPRFDTVRAVFWHNAYLLTTGCLVIDAVKTIMTHDPYFWGVLPLSTPAPAHFPALLQDSAFLTRCYRLTASMGMIWLGLRSVFCMAPVTFAVGLGPSLLGPRGEPWLYPDHYGSFSNVLDRGLAGWWGGWWHQTFRYAFQSAGAWVTRMTGVDPKSKSGKLLAVSVAFGLSGVLHACGSVTQGGATRPLSGPFLFFSLQPVGFALEMTCGSYLKKRGWGEKTPRSLRRTANFLWVHTWFFFTAPLLVDDFARGGLWLFEPFPLSMWRGLGWGIEGSGWYCWQGEWVRWYWNPNGRWWLSGVAF